MGEDFVAANGERSFLLFTIARWTCIPFSCLGAVICYLWARDLYSPPAGVVACAIWCFEPNILAHASLITPDAHATALGLAACYTFWRWLREPTWLQTVLTGAILGVAELAKTTFVLFYPLWPAIWLAYRWTQHGGMTWRAWLREAGMLAARMGIGLYVINLGYGFDQSLKPLGDFQFVSDLFNGRADKDPQSTAFPLKPFAGTSLAFVPVPFPADYHQGIDLQQRDFEHYGRPFFLRGVWREVGWWYYYVYAGAIKVPLGLWLLSIGAVATGSIRRLRLPRGWKISDIVPVTKPLPDLRDIGVLVFPPTVILAVASYKTGLNEHFRYALPCLPALFILTSGLIPSIHYGASRTYLTSREVPVYHSNPGGTRRTLKFAALIPLMVSWLVTSSLWIYPHSLSYFNESVGGPLQGAMYLRGSNLDWGQDLLYLQTWFSREGIDGIILDFNSRYDPKVGGFPFFKASLRDLQQVLTHERRGDFSGKSFRYVVTANRVFAPHWHNQVSEIANATGISIDDARMQRVAGYSLYALTDIRRPIQLKLPFLLSP